MNREQTNGFLSAIEFQLEAALNSLDVLDRTGTMTDQAYAVFREERIKILNAVHQLKAVRAWNRE